MEQLPVDRIRDIRPVTAVLVIQDSPQAGNGLACILEDEGFEVSLAEDWEHAVQLLESGSFGLVVLENALAARRSGTEIGRFAEAMAKTGAPVFVTSSHPTIGSRWVPKGLDISYLRHPLEERQLIAAARAVDLFRQVRTHLVRAGKDNDTALERGKPAGKRITFFTDAENFRGFGRLLGAHGFDVAVRPHPDAWQSWSPAEADLVIIDWSFMSGRALQVLYRLRVDFDCASLPVLMLIVGLPGMGPELVRPEGVGVDRFLTKPFLPEELVTLSEELLARRPAAPGAGSARRLVRFLRKPSF